ncbi:hypothetical protein [Coleofasciculus sp. FACHB-SPT9]|nr:hypothetical protein [Coleofasciculus sp. FACHB-SPT9]
MVNRPDKKRTDKSAQAIAFLMLRRMRSLWLWRGKDAIYWV